jgi:hypothetical protein
MQNTSTLPLFPNCVVRNFHGISRCRSNIFLAGLFFLTLASANLAMGQMGMGLPGDPFFLTLGRTPIPPNSSVTFYYELKIQTTAAGPYNFSAYTVVTNPTSNVATYNDTDLANSIGANLNADPTISAEYTCNVERTIFGYMEVICLVNPNMTPSVIKDTVDVRGAPDMIMSAGTWQGDADITFEIDGTPSASPLDAVFIGLDGYVIEVPTAGQPLATIRGLVLAQLIADGFNATLNPDSTITVTKATDGNPPPQPTGTGDWGGLILSTDPGLIVTAQMKNVNKANEPSAQGFISTGQPDNTPQVGGSVINISVSGFPGSVPVTITVDGQPAGTITTNASGSGSGPITLPPNTTGVTGAPYEIQGSGGGTNGFRWITLQ